jgi:tryptophan synthase alpha chain
MSRISSTFERLHTSRRKGFIPFITAGDPDLSTSLELLLTLAENGADIIELGVPFSDPMADGPIIQRSAQRALCHGTTLSDVIELATRLRRVSDVPIVVFTYYNPLLQFGFETFLERAEGVVDGVLVTDVIGDEAEDLRTSLQVQGIDLISLVAPTTSEDRLRVICSRATGFVYAVARAGVTGIRSEVSKEAEVLVNRIKAVTEVPVAVGFGISNAEQVQDVWRYADAAVVGSAIVAAIERSDPETAVGAVTQMVRSLLPPIATGRAEI